jgi:hypothetical protein
MGNAAPSCAQHHNPWPSYRYSAIAEVTDERRVMTTQNWITGHSGDWSDAADWVSGVVPGSTDSAAIANYSAVTVNGTAVADFLTLNNGSSLTVSGSLTLGTSLAVDGSSTLALSGGTLSAQSMHP